MQQASYRTSRFERAALAFWRQEGLFAAAAAAVDVGRSLVSGERRHLQRALKQPGRNVRKVQKLKHK